LESVGLNFSTVASVEYDVVELRPSNVTKHRAAADWMHLSGILVTEKGKVQREKGISASQRAKGKWRRS